MINDIQKAIDRELIEDINTLGHNWWLSSTSFDKHL